MKVRDVIKQIEQDGWLLDRTRGDHRQYIHPSKPGTITVSGHTGDDMPSGTLNSILKRAGLKR
ncbi:MAG: type II toxin-antitoxin system HicA family toxin [Bryobacteraceae bacterium]